MGKDLDAKIFREVKLNIYLKQFFFFNRFINSTIYLYKIKLVISSATYFLKILENVICKQYYPNLSSR